MKDLIKNYSTPKVDSNILFEVLNKNIKKWINKTKIFSYIFFTLCSLLFMQDLILLNISYIDLIISMFSSVNIYLLLISNIAIGIVYFVYKNVMLISFLILLYYIGKLYEYKYEK